MVLAFVNRLLTPEELVVVRAHYTVPAVEYLEIRKNVDVMLLCQQVFDLKDGPKPDRSYVGFNTNVVRLSANTWRARLGQAAQG